ncbi:Phytochelatin synthase [Obelidium mucronatum]|nr:Phytochelatin synthase [Obelidium mucronatum]
MMDTVSKTTPCRISPNCKTSHDPDAPNTFYRKDLPPNLISFTSKEGKRLLKECLVQGSAESFLHLSGNLTHQSEPAFCGLGSLAIVLNALGVDPKRPWKGAWRWYDETLLDCCNSLETIKQKGIPFDEFTCVGQCHGLHVVSKRICTPPDDIPDNTNITRTKDSAVVVSQQEFIEDLKRIVKDEEGRSFMVISYCRTVLDQTGDGHFSPIGGFHEETGMVLVLDVARFKYPSYFVHVDVLYESMKPVDRETGKSRGYFLLTRAEKEKAKEKV